MESDGEDFLALSPEYGSAGRGRLGSIVEERRGRRGSGGSVATVESEIGTISDLT